MTRLMALLIVLITLTLSATADKKNKGTTSLKDLQPAGTTDTKDKKNQQYDFSFIGSGNQYTCRTSPKTKIKATDFVVGSDMKYEVDGDKGKLKSTSGKEVKCTVVRVERAATPEPAK